MLDNGPTVTRWMLDNIPTVTRWMLDNIPTSNEFLRFSQKFCPSFHYEEKWKSYWVYDRAVVAPTYPIGAGIRSNVVPLLWMMSAAKNLKDYQ